MKLNNKGFTLVELLATMAIMVIVMAIAFPSILGMIRDNKEQKYVAYEKSMVEYAKAYFEDRTNEIGLSELKNVGLTLNDDCIGYVTLSDDKAYLKCGEDYETSGFDETKAS